MGVGKQNFTFTIAGTGTTFVAVSTGVSAQNLTLEMLVPDTTTDTEGTYPFPGTRQFKDCFSTYTNDSSIGCYSSGDREDVTSDWLCTAGGRSNNNRRKCYSDQNNSIVGLDGHN